jgi:hypothetical protein
MAARGRAWLFVVGDASIRRSPPSSHTELRYNINESIDASVFDRWRADGRYRPQNLTEWGEKYRVDLAKLAGEVKAN